MTSDMYLSRLTCDLINEALDWTPYCFRIDQDGSLYFKNMRVPDEIFERLDRSTLEGFAVERSDALYNFEERLKAA